jgi:hypothetical protein
MEDGMKQVACRYAVVQFTPYTETGEFANVGVALACPEMGYFGFKLQVKKYKRVTDFFEELPRDVYLRAMQGIRTELERIAKVIQSAPESGRPAYVRQVFDGLVHPREAIVRMSGTRVVLSEDPEAELTRKFDHYVDRSFATPEYVEQKIEKRIRSLLGSLQIARPFKARKLGDDEVYVRFPLVQMRGDQAAKVIKPLNLSQAEPMGIYDHGDAWLQRLRRLRVHGFLPHDVLIAVQGPNDQDTKRQKAFDEVRRELVALDVTVADADEDRRIAEFAED